MKWHKFSTVITDATSKFRKIKASNYLTSGRYKIIDQSKEPVAGYTDDDSLINEQLRPILIFGDHTRILKYENDPIALGADGAKALWVDPNIADARYVYYYLRSVPIKEAGYSRHFKFLKEVKIPIPYKDGQPDFDYQTRVVYLLGKIEGMIALRKQHLQQLDSLLESVFLELFGDPVRNDKGWDIVPFHKVGKFISGGTPSKSRDDFWNGDFPWVSPKDMKTTKIDNAIDHISETVFEQTSLKRIAPNHLLIVVRGMILAHSFPVAINSVDIAINQDMKAIKPVKDINVVYLLNCLNSLKRQLLKLISTAGHGTRKFDSVSMEKLF
ncbi:type I restriction modification DNA specificity domain protein, partial [Escherichia coli P0301867.8]